MAFFSAETEREIEKSKINLIFSFKQIEKISVCPKKFIQSLTIGFLFHSTLAKDLFSITFKVLIEGN